MGGRHAEFLEEQRVAVRGLLLVGAEARNAVLHRVDHRDQLVGVVGADGEELLLLGVERAELGLEAGDEGEGLVDVGQARVGHLALLGL